MELIYFYAIRIIIRLYVSEYSKRAVAIISDNELYKKRIMHFNLSGLDNCCVLIYTSR